MLPSFRETLWVLEDEKASIFVYRDCLETRYDLKFMESLKELLESASLSAIPFLIADLKVKDGNFLNLLRSEAGKQLGLSQFIVVSSTEDLDVLRACFGFGAADYLTKPFTRSELIVKVERALERRRQPDRLTSFNGVRLDPVAAALTDGVRPPVMLTSKEVQIFSALCDSNGNYVEREVIQCFVWKHVAVGPKTLGVHLVNLRKKLMVLDLEILYEPEKGYRLSGDRMGNLVPPEDGADPRMPVSESERH